MTSGRPKVRRNFNGQEFRQFHSIPIYICIYLVYFLSSPSNIQSATDSTTYYWTHIFNWYLQPLKMPVFSPQRVKVLFSWQFGPLVQGTSWSPRLPPRLTPPVGNGRLTKPGEVETFVMPMVPNVFPAFDSKHQDTQRSQTQLSVLKNLWKDICTSCVYIDIKTPDPA